MGLGWAGGGGVSAFFTNEQTGEDGKLLVYLYAVLYGTHENESSLVFFFGLMSTSNELRALTLFEFCFASNENRFDCCIKVLCFVIQQDYEVLRKKNKGSWGRGFFSKRASI